MKYIVNADDFGRTETVNEAIVYGFNNGYLSRTTVMVNMPCFDDAVMLSKEHGFLDKVGLHINLTSGVPLTAEIKSVATIVGENGYFNGSFFGNKRMRFILTPKERKAVIAEMEAQVKKYIDSGFTLMHADSHGHVHTFESLRGIVKKVLLRNSFNSLRMMLNLNTKSNLKLFVKNQINRILQDKFNLRNKTDYLGSYKDVIRNEKLLEQRDGICEIMLHPNIYDYIMQIGEGLTYSDLDAIKGEIINE